MSLTHVTVGLGWDPAPPTGPFGNTRKDIDLNVTALAFAGYDFVDAAFHEQLTSRDGALRHLGDSVTGDGDGDNEVITVDLTRVAAAIDTIVFLVTCYTGQTFDQVVNGFCRVSDSVSGMELVRVDLSRATSHTGFVLAKLRRAEASWEFVMIGDPILADHPTVALPQLTVYLGAV
ncbi:TerD family protein [Nocardia caishijiensis]|uniref:Tellurium resistance protein TerZ n=1 Tax=Nocardia caishijiensis TaxID=184756 RepID=A0ABQ6YJS8_9NOCA|nr:TerD family protein [Nocardia caishijiensis]KAF0846044.1 tellurium resistance protein TerZ [Nocardia caishijiensis]